MERTPEGEGAASSDVPSAADVPVEGAADALAREAAFDRLVAEHRTGLVRSVAHVVGDRQLAEDVVQEALGKAYASWRRVGRYDAPVAWVRMVAVRDAIRVAGRDRRRPVLEARAAPVAGSAEGAGGPLAGAGPDPAAHLDLHAALDRLPPKQRAAVVLHYLDDLPVAQVGSVLGCSTSTAKVHLHRARATLADLLGEETT